MGSALRGMLEVTPSFVREAIFLDIKFIEVMIIFKNEALSGLFIIQLRKITWAKP